MEEHALVTKQKNLLAAVQICVQRSGLDNEDICEKLAIDPGHFSRMMRGTANLQLAKLPSLMRLCGNIAPLQWLAHEMGYELTEVSKNQRIAELEALLAKLKDAA